jgi:hypothetical protein
MYKDGSVVSTKTLGYPYLHKSPGVDGIPPKLLLEIIEQISIPLATVFNLSLEKGVVPLFKKVQETSQRTIDQ